MDQQDDCTVRRSPLIQSTFQNGFQNENYTPSHIQPPKLDNISEHLNVGVETINIAVYLMSGVVLTMEVEQLITAQNIMAIIQLELGLSRLNPINGQQIFAMWMCSSKLEVQLNPKQKPVELAIKWKNLIKKYTSKVIKKNDEPLLYFRRNVFLSRKNEEQIKETKVLELLYAEAKYNVLEGRYPCEGQTRYANLGALQARIELGPYNSQTHTLAYFRKHRATFLPHHHTSPSILLGLGFGLGIVGGKGAPEARLLEQYKRIPNHSAGTNPNSKKLVRKYLEFCWGLPSYGAAFFHGQIERPVRGLASWITNRDLPILIAINTTGVYIVDDKQCSLLLGLKYSELNWEMAKPSDENNPDCLPCLFLQFPVRENGTRVYKILQVFSKQAVMMDTLISVFAEESRNENDNSTNENTMVITNTGNFTNKLSKFTLATFDEQGRCIGQMGSWSFQ